MNTCIITIAAIVGGVVLLKGADYAVRFYRTRKRGVLEQIGRTINATLTEVEQVEAHRTYDVAHSRSRYIPTHYNIKALWDNPETREVYEFSMTVYAVTEPSYQRGQTIPVLIDPNHPHRYIMDPQQEKSQNRGHLSV